MGTLKDMLQSNVVNPATHANSSITTVGVVTSSDESNNTVSIRYIDKSGNKSNRDNVTVRLYGNGADWFPSVNEAVIVEDTGDTCVVVARHVNNYAMDVRAKRQLKQDVYSDEPFCPLYGGYVM